MSIATSFLDKRETMYTRVSELMGENRTNRTDRTEKYIW